MRHMWMTVGVMMAAVSPADAQHRGGAEVGVFGRYAITQPAQYGASTASSSRTGVGARLGIGLRDRMAIEADAGQTYADVRPGQPGCIAAALCDFTATSVSARLLAHAPIRRGIEVVAGVGPTYQELAGAIGGTYWGAHALAGAKVSLGERLALRADVTQEWMPSGRAGRAANTTNAQVGVSIRLGKPCRNGEDYLSVGPVDSHVQIGEVVALEGDAVTCQKPDLVTYRLQGPGELDPYTGRYKATAPGIATIFAVSTKGQLATEVRVRIQAPVVAADTVATPIDAPRAEAADTTPKFVFNVRGIFFKFDESKLNKAGMDTLKLAAQTLRERPSIELEVVGHTDHTGPAEYNLRLSKARALAVTSFLIREGVKSERITTKWKGESEPIADNRTAEGRAMNRRVVIRQTN